MSISSSYILGLIILTPVSNVDEINRKEFGDVLNCMGLWHLHQGDYLRALVHFQSAERYAMMYSNSQDTMANQMKVVFTEICFLLARFSISSIAR